MNWVGVNVLVTGADGFIGSHLVERLAQEGARVRAFCFYNSNGSWGWLDEAEADVKKSLNVRLGDIRDARFVEEACRDIEVVFHLSALVAIPYSYQAPESCFVTKVKGTLNVLEGVRRHGCRRMVHTSTSEVYGTPETLPIRETHPLKGQSPYSASKIAADKLCEAYFHSYDVPVVTVRPFNTYGPRQSTRAILPTILVQLLSGSKATKLGSLDPRRDLTYVSDTVEGLVKAAFVDGIEGEVIHLGTGSSVSIGELFDLANRMVNANASVILDEERVRPNKSEVMVLLSDPEKARRLLEWRPGVSLEQGLNMTIEWLREHADLYDPNRYHV